MSSISIFLAVWFIGSLVLIFLLFKRLNEMEEAFNESEQNRIKDELSHKSVVDLLTIDKTVFLDLRAKISILENKVKTGIEVCAERLQLLRVKDVKINELEDKLNPVKAYEYKVRLPDGAEFEVIADDVMPTHNDNFIFYLDSDIVLEIKNVQAVFKGKEVKQCGDK